ncbi:MAG: hypothetical protein IRZ00_08275 [Gemmatimonadetes bacterium]|nr:hypothetical protein [Gemmatimonadota bacterium]
MTMMGAKRLRRRAAARAAWRLARPALAALVVACHASPEQRERVLAEAARVDQTIASGTVVRDLRSPTDSTAVIYTPPPSLALRPPAAGAPAVTAPFGISAPDTLRARGATVR